MPSRRSSQFAAWDRLATSWWTHRSRGGGRCSVNLWRGLTMSVDRGRAEVTGSRPNDAFDPQRTWHCVMDSTPKSASQKPNGNFLICLKVEASSTSANSSQAWRKLMIRLIAFAAFALAVTTSAQAMTIAPVHEPDGIITQVAFGCGPFRTRVGGVCVARTTIRHVRREVRRCALWHGGVCARWVY